MDITVVMSMTWRDVRLSWDLLSWNYMNNIWVDSNLIWTPNLHFSNRVQDFGPLQEVALRSNIGFDGKVIILINYSPIHRTCNPFKFYYSFEGNELSITATPCFISIKFINVSI